MNKLNFTYTNGFIFTFRLNERSRYFSQNYNFADYACQYIETSDPEITI